MWLPLQLVLEFIGRAAAWLAVMAALAGLAALVVTLVLRRLWRSFWPGPLAGAIVGALLGASLADRFGLPEPFTFQVWCRAVPLAWSAGGAVLGALAVALWPRRAGPRPSPAGPTDDSPARPTDGEGG